MVEELAGYELMVGRCKDSWLPPRLQPSGRVSATEPPGARRRGEKSRAVVQHPPRQRFWLFPGCAALALYSSSLAGKRRAVRPPWAAAPRCPSLPVTRLPACRLPAGTYPATGVCGDLWGPLLGRVSR